jgi:nucleoside-diphosphate-sugar epimerase
MKTILLTGAAGSVGLEALRELVRRKDRYAIRVLEVRSPRTEKTLRPFRREVEIQWADLASEASLAVCVRNVDSVIHLAAIIPPLADRQPALAERVNVQGTQNLVEALQRRAPEAFFLYSSSVSVYGDRVQNPWIEVTDLLRPSEGDYYAVTKIKAEQIIKSSDLRWTIFRLTGIFNPRQKLDPLLFHMPLDTCIEMATTRDTGYALVEALERRITEAHVQSGRRRKVPRHLLRSPAGLLCRGGLGRYGFPRGGFRGSQFSLRLLSGFRRVGRHPAFPA